MIYSGHAYQRVQRIDQFTSHEIFRPSDPHATNTPPRPATPRTIAARAASRDIRRARRDIVAQRLPCACHILVIPPPPPYAFHFYFIPLFAAPIRGVSLSFRNSLLSVGRLVWVSSRLLEKRYWEIPALVLGGF